MKKINLLVALIILTISTLTAQKGAIDNSLQKLEVNCSINKAYNLAYRTAAEFNWMIKSSDSKILTFSAVTPQLMSRWDDNVNVYIDSLDVNKSIINVKSTLVHKPNISYITSYLTKINEKLNIK